MNGDGRKYDTGSGRIFQGSSRSQKRADNILGLINMPSSGSKTRYRSSELREVEKYMEGSQYDGLMNWDAGDCDDEHIPLYKKKPKIIFPFAKVFSERISSKLVGGSTFPKFKIADDPDTEFFLNLIIDESHFKAKMLDAAKNFAAYNSVFVRFRMVNGAMRLDKYNTNYCYPEFGEDNSLVSIEIKYVYEDEADLDKNGAPIKKWYKLELSQNSDILYDNPVASDHSDPVFVEVSRVDHGLGFVQGEWISKGESPTSYDGDSTPFICDASDFIDSINYKLSQMDKASAYGMEPQLALSGMDSEEIDGLIKSASKAWALGREGKAAFLEVNGSGAATGKIVTDDMFKRVQDISRVVMLDPEKMAANAQSGKAMEVMHAPLVELINELRPWFEKGMKGLLTKMTETILISIQMGMETEFIVPPGYVPQSLSIKVLWPPVFELTTQDKQQIVSLAIQASNANLIARDTAGKWIQSQGVDFGVEDWELEVQKINGQKTFGGFF